MSYRGKVWCVALAANFGLWGSFGFTVWVVFFR